LDWRPDLSSVQDYADIAAATQRIYEEIFELYVKIAADKTKSKNLVLMGGCALNCVANTLAYKYFDNVWIMPNPGDAGSAIGCVLAHKREFMEFSHAFTGTEIPGEYPIDAIIQALQKEKITAVAAGRAEFGPRALGHRSILADPRGLDVKDRVNSIKQREAFRPFAPMILEEHADKYFEMPKQLTSSPFMQFVVKCREPDEFPAIIHYDGTSRVQTVSKENGNVRMLLERWYKLTGCPMLLNTSLNIKGEPLVNTREDADRWSKKYGVKVCLPESGDGL
jgi:carbamoyltransferase